MNKFAQAGLTDAYFTNVKKVLLKSKQDHPMKLFKRLIDSGQVDPNGSYLVEDTSLAVVDPDFPTFTVLVQINSGQLI